MRLDSLHLKCILDDFRSFDRTNSGLIPRAELERVLESLGCAGAGRILDEWLATEACTGFSAAGEVSYEDFLAWLHRPPAVAKPRPASRPPRPITLPPIAPAAARLEEIADGLMKLASSAGNPTASAEIASHAASLKLLCQSEGCASGVQRPLSSASTASSSASAATHVPRGNDIAQSFRSRAAEVVERRGRPGELVDDLQEVAIADLKNKSAMSCWRPCHGLRLYRSETVKKALRLICSAPVPGLGATSYLDVFNTLTGSGWEHHIFLFGGLVRDILRRKVGNDIDITFSAPAAELAEICQRHGFKCQLEGDYILIGDEMGNEYLEGMVITHNGITPPENSDFSMNWVFYDFCNDVVIDKTGYAVPAVVANRCEIPCAREKWDAWVKIGGARVLFRYYKFLVRGFEYQDAEMAFIAERLLGFWRADAAGTVDIGKDALGALLSSQDSAKLDRLRQLVFISFGLATQCRVDAQALVRRGTPPGPGALADGGGSFSSASAWWQLGWLQMIN